MAAQALPAARGHRPPHRHADGDPLRGLVDTSGAVSYEVLRAAAHDAVRRTILRPIELVRCVEQEICVPTGASTYRVDVGYRAIKHGFEFMSEEWHLNREAFHRDSLRVMRLQRAGWTIWPVTSRTAHAEILLTMATVPAFRQLRAA